MGWAGESQYILCSSCCVLGHCKDSIISLFPHSTHFFSFRKIYIISGLYNSGLKIHFKTTNLKIHSLPLPSAHLKKLKVLDTTRMYILPGGYVQIFSSPVRTVIRIHEYSNKTLRSHEVRSMIQTSNFQLHSEYAPVQIICFAFGRPAYE